MLLYIKVSLDVYKRQVCLHYRNLQLCVCITVAFLLTLLYTWDVPTHNSATIATYTDDRVTYRHTQITQ